MDKNSYGNELTRYKLDYLDGHKNIDAMPMTLDIIIYDKGMKLSSKSHKDSIYLRWDEIESIVYYKESAEKIEIDYEEGKTITLEKVDKSTNMTDMLLKIKSLSPDIEILEKSEVYVNSQKDPEEGFFSLDEQDLRIHAFLADIEDDDLLKIYEKWESHLMETLKFPFEAEISEPQEDWRLQVGDELTVKSISGTDDLYGILVNVTKKRRRFVLPLCDLEVVDEKSRNYLPVSDYGYWFSNYR